MSLHPVGAFGTDVGVPTAPPGPGVAPPFAAPPTDRNKRGLWIGLGVGALVLVLCAVGGVVGFGILIVGGTEQLKRDATAAVTRHLDGLRDGDFAAAHAEFCRRLARTTSPAALAAETRQRPFTEYRLDEPRIPANVEVTAHFRITGVETSRTYVLETEGQELKICTIR